MIKLDIVTLTGREANQVAKLIQLCQDLADMREAGEEYFGPKHAHIAVVMNALAEIGLPEELIPQDQNVSTLNFGRG